MILIYHLTQVAYSFHHVLPALLLHVSELVRSTPLVPQCPDLHGRDPVKYLRIRQKSQAQCHQLQTLLLKSSHHVLPSLQPPYHQHEYADLHLVFGSGHYFYPERLQKVCRISQYFDLMRKALAQLLPLIQIRSQPPLLIEICVLDSSLTPSTMNS